MESFRMGRSLFLVALITLLFATAHSATNDEDVYALNVLFTTLNSPPLTGWMTSGGDPCAENWEGVACAGPNVTSLKLSGLNLVGELGYALQNLSALIVLDLSNNLLSSVIPYQLPPHAQQLILSANHFTGGLPYSLTYLSNLAILNVSSNLLSEDIPDVFVQSGTLTIMDLSNNSFSGSLPSSLGVLTSLETLYMQNNQLTGTVDILVNLPLKDLDISNNNFTGWIPSSLKSISSFKHDGNDFNTSPAPPPPPFLPSPPPSHGTPSQNPGHKFSDGKGETQTKGGEKRYLTGGRIAGMVIAAVLAVAAAVLLVLFFAWKRQQDDDEEKHVVGSPWRGPLIPPIKDQKEKSEHNIKASPEMVSLKPPPKEIYKAPMENTKAVTGPSKSVKTTIVATSYSVAELQTATNSFAQENLLGEGTLGRVFKAELPSGKLLAVKKLDNAVSMVREEDFLDVLSSISRLRHSNITELVGYSVEHGQRLLVYEYISNGTLHENLHCGEEKSIRLSWNLRVKIALGAARALEYLHEVFSPMVVHRNLKSANILLDDEFNPHLSDSGIAALTSFGSQCQVSAQHLGSFGYSAPEYAMSGVYTVKSDIYSFGVVMLELLTGRKPLDSSRPRAEQSLVRWATPQLYDIDALAKMVDPSLKGIYPAKSLSRFADIIALCVQPEPEFRPPMSEVTQSLVRLMQRASLSKRREDLGSSHNSQD